MTDRAAAENWVARYRVAWESNDPDDIGALFTDDARYFVRPDEQPFVGVEAIIERWLGHADEPGTTDFDFEMLAVDGEVAVARCVSTYSAYDPPRVWDNLFVVRLADDGRATELTDWYVERAV